LRTKYIFKLFRKTSWRIYINLSSRKTREKYSNFPESLFSGKTQKKTCFFKRYIILVFRKKKKYFRNKYKTSC